MRTVDRTRGPGEGIETFCEDNGFLHSQRLRTFALVIYSDGRTVLERLKYKGKVFRGKGVWTTEGTEEDSSGERMGCVTPTTRVGTRK